MKAGYFKIFLILLLAFVLLRFAPIVLSLGQAAAFAVRAYWWAVIPLVICTWLIWKSKKRVSAAAAAAADPALRDVTDSIKDPSTQ